MLWPPVASSFYKPKRLKHLKGLDRDLDRLFVTATSNRSTMMTLNTTISVDIEQPSVRSYCIGLMITALCIPGLIGNVLVSYVEISKGFLSSNSSSMYNLSFNLILADTVHLALLAFYLGPSSTVQSWLLPDNWTREIPGRTLMVCWYNMLIDLCLLGINR